MAPSIRRHDAEQGGEQGAAELSAHVTSPSRTVFTEPGNADGWIATDLTVELER